MLEWNGMVANIENGLALDQVTDRGESAETSSQAQT